MRVELTKDDLVALRDRVAVFAPADRRELSRVLVSAEGPGPARWAATDMVRLGALPVGVADGPVRAAVPVRTVVLAAQMAERRGSEGATVELPDVDSGSGSTGVLRLHDGVELPFDADLEGFPPVESHLDGWDAAWDDEGADATTLAATKEDLLALVYGATLPPAGVAVPGAGAIVGLGAEPTPRFRLVADATSGVLRGTASWEDHPDTSAAVPCRASRHVDVAVNPELLYSLVQAVADEEVELLIPPSSTHPVRTRGADGFQALLMPMTTGAEAARPDLEATIAVVLGSAADELERDDRGRYVIQRPGRRPVAIELLEGEESLGTVPRALVTSVLGSDLPASPDLLRELNDINRGVAFARAWWSDGEVVVGAELNVGDIPVEELERALATVSELADRIAPLLALVHWG